MEAYYFTKGLFWIRLFGRGFSIKNVNNYPLLFSERYGYAKGFKIGKYYFKLFKHVW